MFPVGWNGEMGDESTLMSMSAWTSLDPVFRSRLLSMFMASGGKVGFGEGFRSSEQQAAGHNDKPNTVAPPGKSWHEVGMAVDIVGDMDWLQENAAKYGLKTFADVNDEPWHVQPIEVPNARPEGAPAPQLSGSGSSMSDVNDQGTGPVTIPADMKVIAVTGPDGVERMYAIHTISPGVHISYSFEPGTALYNEAAVHHVTQAESDQLYGRGIWAGDAAELVGVQATHGSYGRMWESILGQVMGYNNPAKDDPEVLAVIAEFAGRPDMSPTELQNKLQATQWYQSRSTGELEWNSLSDQERQTRLDEMASRMQGTVFQFMGADIDASDPRIANYLEQVASGKLGFGAWTTIIKDQARDMPESPWARQVRDEQEEQNQRPIDIENTAQKIRETAERWGIQWSPETIQKWAKDIVEKVSSDEDLINELKAQAQVLYPWKSPEVETATAASPWLETYRRVMETSGTIFTPQVAKALQGGQAVFDFETELKKSGEWLNTKNGQDEMFSYISEMGARMGFV